MPGARVAAMRLNRFGFAPLPQSPARCSESLQIWKFQMRLRTKALCVLLAASLVASVTPAFAGPAETAFLQRLTANWTGRGKVSGPDGGPIACRIVISGGQTSIKYQGRCAIPDMATQAFNGAISYNDQLKRYETHSVGGSAVGVRRGDSLVFTTSERTIGGTSTSTMSISPNSLVVDFSLVDSKGQKTSSHITFGK